MCRRTRLIKALKAGGIAINAPAARQLVDMYFSSMQGRYFRDTAGWKVYLCHHQQTQQLSLQPRSNLMHSS